MEQDRVYNGKAGKNHKLKEAVLNFSDLRFSNRAITDLSTKEATQNTGFLYGPRCIIITWISRVILEKLDQQVWR